MKPTLSLQFLLELELGKACSILLFGLWTYHSLETVTKSKGGCNFLLLDCSCVTLTKSLKEAVLG